MNTTLNNLEIASRSTVMLAAKQFAEALGDSPQFREFEQSNIEYQRDAEAKSIIQEFQIKQSSLKALMMLNTVREEDRQELQNLHERFYLQPSVVRYSEAQEELVLISQEIGDLLSKAIGLDYATSCSSTGGCCG